MDDSAVGQRGSIKDADTHVTFCIPEKQCSLQIAIGKERSPLDASLTAIISLLMTGVSIYESVFAHNFLFSLTIISHISFKITYFPIQIHLRRFGNVNNMTNALSVMD